MSKTYKKHYPKVSTELVTNYGEVAQLVPVKMLQLYKSSFCSKSPKSPKSPKSVTISSCFLKARPKTTKKILKQSGSLELVNRERSNDEVVLTSYSTIGMKKAAKSLSTDEPNNKCGYQYSELVALKNKLLKCLMSYSKANKNLESEVYKLKMNQNRKIHYSISVGLNSLYI